MTPSEKCVLRSLVVVAWADGQMAEGETGVIDGLLSGFDASEEEEAEIFEYARSPRTLEEDLPVAELGPDDREVLFSNAVLLTRMDGEQSEAEKGLLSRLSELLGFSSEQAEALAEAVLGSEGSGGLPEE